MNRGEANAEIAKRLGWDVRPKRLLNGHINSFALFNPEGEVESSYVTTPKFAWECVPDYFTEHDSSRRLVEWFWDDNGATFQEAEMFKACLADVLRVDVEFISVWDGLLATSEQKAIAACRVWGIEVTE